MAALGLTLAVADPAAATEPPQGTVTHLARTTMLSDAAAAARVQRSGWEPRPGNRAANTTTPSRAQLARFHARDGSWGRCEPLRRRVTGNFRGTTDEILQWAALKWGLAPDLLRAQAAQESWWRADTVGDGGQSIGLMQVKRTAHEGTMPMARNSSAFNVDYYAAYLRYVYSGCATWLRNVRAGARYRAGDLWGSVGVWYSGRWYHRNSEYLAKVRGYLARRVWRSPGF